MDKIESGGSDFFLWRGWRGGISFGPRRGVTVFADPEGGV